MSGEMRVAEEPRIRIAVVAPYDELVSEIHNLSTSNGYIWQVRLGNLSEGVKVGRAIERQGADVIVSRGGTASSLREAVSIPVVEIEVTGFDLVRAFTSVRDQFEHFGIIGFPNVIRGISELGALLGFSINEYYVESEAKVVAAVEQARSEGVECIAGDKIAVDIARRAGLPAQLIQSGPEAIGRALDEAYRVAKLRKTEQARIQKLQTILDTVSDGVIVITKAGRITELNDVATRLLDRNADELEGRLVRDVLPDWKNPAGSKETNDLILKTDGGRTLVCSFRPMWVGEDQWGAILIVQDVHRLQRTEEKVRRKLNAHGHVARYTFDDVVADSRQMKDLLNKLVAYAKVDSTVLILGESGSGKELIAQSLHSASPRQVGPFVAVNCAALPANLLETELFGYDEGAFTGARRTGKRGVFELAHRGTIFLDEIAEMPLELQGRLLRVLEEREIVRVGGETVIPVDIRVVAATNRDLIEEVAQGRFREDLYYRINVLMVKLPPLRNRRADIVALAKVFLTRLAEKYRRELDWGESGLEALAAYPWPGNIRELENVVERLVLTASDLLIERSHVEAAIGPEKPQKGHVEPAEAPGGEIVDSKTYQRKMILHLLENGWTHEQIAKRINASRTTVWRRIREMKTGTLSGSG